MKVRVLSSIISLSLMLVGASAFADDHPVTLPNILYQ